MPSLARAPDFSRGELKHSNTRGSALPEKPWVPKAKSCPSSGWSTPRHLGCAQMIGVASMWSSTEPQPTARRCAAMPRWCRRSPARGSRNLARPTSTALPFGQQSDAKPRPYPELQKEGPQRLVVLGSEVGGRFNGDAHCLLRDLVRVRACRAPPALRSAAASGWTRRWWSMLSVAVQQAVASTALGRPWPQPPHAPCATGPPLDRLLDLAEAEGPSRLPLRPPPQSQVDAGG